VCFPQANFGHFVLRDGEREGETCVKGREREKEREKEKEYRQRDLRDEIANEPLDGHVGSCACV